MRKNNKKGFTLAELLIVVAIIAVLVAIAIPVFTSQLEKSRESVDLANIRSYYAEIVPAIMTGDFDDANDHITVGGTLTATTPEGVKGSTGAYQNFTVELETFAAKQAIAQWQTTADLEIGGFTIPTTADAVNKTKITYSFTVQADGDIVLSGIAFS